MRKRHTNGAEKEPIKRYNITLTKRARKCANEMASKDMRSFSNLLEVLIFNEAERRKAA